MSLDGVELLRLDVERLCGDLVDQPPAMQLRTLAALREMRDEVPSSALASAMVSARGGIAPDRDVSVVSYEQVRRMLVVAGGPGAAE
jgi:hypothetical protein